MSTLAERQIRSLLINPAWASYIELPEYLTLTGDFACLANLAELIKSRPQPPTGAHILEHMRGSPYEATINRIFQSTLNDPEALEGSSEEDLANFRHGMTKLFNELKNTQIETLKEKNRQTGLNENEKKLLLALLMPPAMVSWLRSPRLR